jgi:hypothetical protein
MFKAVFITVLLTAAVAIFGAIAWTYAVHGEYGLLVVWRRGGSVWPVVSREDPRLTPAARLALHGAVATSGDVTWAPRAPGFESGDLPLLVDGKEADRLLLARIDPKLWRISAHSAPAGDRDLAGWMRTLGAALVVNGSYYGEKGEPDTPFRGGGVDLGPTEYHGSHGAFVSNLGEARIVDLEGVDWRKAFDGGSDAFVSYPLLLDRNGKSRASPSQWLANRSFIAQDRAGRIVIGTSADAVLTLANLANVLKTPQLDLALALNLDGGPVACQAIDVGDFQRKTCGRMEIQADATQVRLLQPVFSGGDWALPVVLAVTPN